MDAVFLRGFATSAALIVAIGAQNAFVLRQGLQRAHVLPVVLVCALSDILLIGLGVAGLGRWVQDHPDLLALTRWGGAAFLLVYGALAARRALAPHALTTQGPAVDDLRGALAACLAFTYLNPHCWLDTVVLLGSIAAQQPEGTRAAFGAGAASASAVWFFALGYGARLLAPWFARPAAWRALDAGIALVMWTIAAGLIWRW
ncbi:LysE/ArgO family amino acid transporter [uncultured Piscinibacter sp.]|uniref:LysE/ArgO family amino acid transporter n=1 Tax=uncultured Piscinibacter sp. TaxID=1131835 RepID=UPI00262C8074|nr:LysE/ArgO family amino acid transporter [uncultured Piscinibacter sp.]